MTINEYKTLIADKVKDIDIAMVFLNAGFIAVGEFRLFSNQEVQNGVSVNAL